MSKYAIYLFFFLPSFPVALMYSILSVALWTSALRLGSCLRADSIWKCNTRTCPDTSVLAGHWRKSRRCVSSWNTGDVCWTGAHASHMYCTKSPFSFSFFSCTTLLEWVSKQRLNGGKKNSVLFEWNTWTVNYRSRSDDKIIDSIDKLTSIDSGHTKDITGVWFTEDSSGVKTSWVSSRCVGGGTAKPTKRLYRALACKLNPKRAFCIVYCGVLENKRRFLCSIVLFVEEWLGKVWMFLWLACTHITPPECLGEVRKPSKKVFWPE